MHQEALDIWSKRLLIQCIGRNTHHRVIHPGIILELIDIDDDYLYSCYILMF